MATQMDTDSTRRPYGRVYAFATIPSPKYSARIWDAKGRDIWNYVGENPDTVYEVMKAAAQGMDGPVDLYRHGDGAEVRETTVGKDLPF